MFPFDDHTWFYLASHGIAGVGVAVVFFGLRTGRKLIFLLLIAALCAFGPWLISEDDPGNGYHTLGLVVVSGALVFQLATGAVWGLIVRAAANWLYRRFLSNFRAFWKTAIMIVAGFGPFAAFAVFTINAQTIPVAACSQEGLTFTVGRQAFDIPLHIGAGVERYESNTLGRMAMRYSSDSDRKFDLSRLCGMSDGGSRPVPVDELRLNYSKFQTVAVSHCLPKKGADAPLGCNTLRRQTVASLRLSVEPRNKLHLSWLDNQPRSDSTAGGDEDNGYVCHKIEGTDLLTNCIVWLKKEDDLYLLAESKRFRQGSDADLVTDIRKVVDFTLSVLEKK